MNANYPKPEIEKAKPKRPSGEFYGMPPHAQPELHVYREDDGGYAVWLNTGVANFDGLCIGTGASRQAAITEAVAVAEWIENMLQGPPPR